MPHRMTESEVNNKNETSQGVKTLLLVGNSPNLVDEFNSRTEWSRMLKDLRRGLEDYLDGIEESASFPQIMQAIGNLYRMHAHIEDENNTGKKIEDQLINWFYEVGQLAPTAIHRMLADLDFDYYLTTNYDFALDKVLLKKKTPGGKLSYKKDHASVMREFFEEGKICPESGDTGVYHIHGKISDPESMIMSPRSYRIAVEKLDKYWDEKKKLAEEKRKDGWLGLFCAEDVHICGFNPRPEESIFWYALEQRFLAIQEKDIAIPYSRTFVYLFYKEGDADDMKEKKALEALLKTYAVTTVFIPVRGGDYVSAWKQLIGEILLRKMKLHIHQSSHKNEDGDEGEELSDELVECLQKTERGRGRIASRGKNMSTAFTNHYKFLNHCLFTLSASKRANIKRLGRWLCYCKIDGRTYMYEFPYLGSIPPCLTEGDGNVHVLVNYKTGELFCLNDKHDKMTSLGKGCNINDIKDFVSRINVPK